MARWTRKDYESTANVLRTLRRRVSDQVKDGEITGDYAQGVEDTHRDLCKSWADAYEFDNPRFKRELFLTACGYVS